MWQLDLALPQGIGQARGLGLVVTEEVALPGDGDAEEDDGECEERDGRERDGTEAPDLVAISSSCCAREWCAWAYRGVRVMCALLSYRDPHKQRRALVFRHPAALLAHRQPASLCLRGHSLQVRKCTYSWRFAGPSSS